MRPSTHGAASTAAASTSSKAAGLRMSRTMTRSKRSAMTMAAKTPTWCGLGVGVILTLTLTLSLALSLALALVTHQAVPSGHIDEGTAAVGAQLVARAREELGGLEELLAVEGLPPVRRRAACHAARFGAQGCGIPGAVAGAAARG